VEAKRYAAMLDMMKKEETERAARAKVLLPLLAKIACADETGSVKIGKNYPTIIDCARQP
jgi:molybdenum cofactor biosynthesis enzyme